MQVENNLGKRSKAVGGAASIWNNVKVGLVFLLIDSYNKHGGILAGGRDDNLFSTTLHQSLKIKIQLKWINMRLVHAKLLILKFVL